MAFRSESSFGATTTPRGAEGRRSRHRRSYVHHVQQTSRTHSETFDKQLSVGAMNSMSGGHAGHANVGNSTGCASRPNAPCGPSTAALRIGKKAIATSTLEHLAQLSMKSSVSAPTPGREDGPGPAASRPYLNTRRTKKRRKPLKRRGGSALRTPWTPIANPTRTGCVVDEGLPGAFQNEEGSRVQVPENKEKEVPTRDGARFGRRGRKPGLLTARLFHARGWDMGPTYSARAASEYSAAFGQRAAQRASIQQAATTLAQGENNMALTVEHGGTR